MLLFSRAGWAFLVQVRANRRCCGIALLSTLLPLWLTGCGDHHPAPETAAAVSAVSGPDHSGQEHSGHDHTGHDHSGHDHGDHSDGAAGIALPALVREHLGVTFAQAEYRVVQGVLRFPGRFAAEPGARHTYQVPLAGRIEVLVAPYQRVEVGTPLYRLIASSWHDLQRDLAVATSALEQAPEQLAAAAAQVEAASAALATWQERVASLERLATQVGGQATAVAEAKERTSEMVLLQADARSRWFEARREAQGADGAAAGGLAAIRLRQLLAEAAAITGLSPDELATVVAGRPRWQELQAPVICAQSAGIVEGEVATSGSWLPVHAPVLTITDPAGVHLRASALQGDLAQLSAGQSARIVGVDPQDSLQLPATMALAPVIDPNERTVGVIARPQAGATLPPSIRPGLVAVLEVVVAGSAEEELAIPRAATIRNGMDVVFFRRHRSNPDVVEMLSADLGASDGRWVVINSGLKEGDEVVLGGIYPLKLSQQGGGTQAGHFEADGTFHIGSH